MSVQPLYQDTKTRKVYAKFLNELHWIASPETLSAVFGPSEELQIDKSVPTLIAEGFQINGGSCLIASGGGIYLYTNGKKYLIASGDALTKYQFRGKTYPRDSQDNILAAIVLDSVPDGGSIS